MQGGIRLNSLSPEAIETGILSCLDCGKCTSRCPISRFDDGISPRLMIDEYILSLISNANGSLLDLCLTCGSCESKCPSNVKFTEFIRLQRKSNNGIELADCSGGLMVETMVKMMLNPEVSPSRLDWLDDGLRTSEKGDYLYFTGCNPIFQVAFEERGEELPGIPRAAVGLLNLMGIEPVVLPGERCCGHDQLWWGEQDTFEALAKMNIKMIQESGAKVVVTTCPECQLTLSREYPELGLEGVKVVSLLELLLEKIGPEAFKEIPEQVVTIQDSCRMTHHLGNHSLPRDLLNRVPGLKLMELAESGENATCCGSSFHACTSVSRRIQAQRIREAQDMGVETIVTLCPKCMLHVTCARDGEELDMPVLDATHFIAMSLGLIEPDAVPVQGVEQ